MLTIVLIKAIACSVIIGIIYIGWFFATARSVPKQKPAHNAFIDFLVYSVAGCVGAAGYEIFIAQEGLLYSFTHQAVPIVSFAMLFTAMNQIKRIRYGQSELVA